MNKLSFDPHTLSKLKRQAKSKIKFDAIIEAMEIYNDYRNAWNSDFFLTEMKFRGWEYMGHGLYKECISKGSIVVKFIRHCYATWEDPNATLELIREYDQWVNPPEVSFRKYLPRTYALFDYKILIQDKVLVKCIKEYKNCVNECIQTAEVKLLADRYNLQDYQTNHGHTLNGSIKFFDSVWNRCRKVEYEP
jgi:hypothetical protein